MEVSTTNTSETNDSSDENSTSKNKQKQRGKKRKRIESDSSTTGEDMLPENMLLLENKVYASAIKNNLDETSVRKILKKVVTNDRVLALVKKQEENQSNTNEKDDKTVTPKLTRSKVRELMKASPKTAWNLENLELTPIKHIPVKTRPEVKALIAQELPDDEDDEEYNPNNDEVLSDDDPAMESCSDLESQPRTPATPKSQKDTSPKLIKDGPFKVPQELTAAAKRKLELEEEATIALRTRSKLSLSSTSIEHIESTFVPPDDIPCPDTDDLWNQFLESCLNPASTSRHEEDDETDPEYNVAADPDAHDEDEEGLSNSIIKISKKELNDLVTELFHIMPDATFGDDLAENLANTVLTDNSRSAISRWEGKQEPLSDEEHGNISNRITFEKTPYSRVSVGKTEPNKLPEQQEPIQQEKYHSVEQNSVNCVSTQADGEPVGETRNFEAHNTNNAAGLSESNVALNTDKVSDKTISITIIESEENPVPTQGELKAPPSLRIRTPEEISHKIEIQIEAGQNITADQVLILQQQLRQHIQLAASNYLQLYVHPLFWSYAPTYKKYLVTIIDLTKKYANSVANVCNLMPAMELMTSWEATVSQDTPQNVELIQFVQRELDKNRRNAIQNHLYVGQFPELFKDVVMSSSVFLYPHLLPTMPYRASLSKKRSAYLESEDSLIALGLEQFNEYVTANNDVAKLAAHPRRRPAFWLTIELVAKHMCPWLTAYSLKSHIATIRCRGHKSNPILKFLKTGQVDPVQHKLLPFDPSHTMLDLPATDIPTTWLRHLAKKTGSPKYRNKSRRVKEPEGRLVAMNTSSTPKPLPSDFTKVIPRYTNSDPDDAERVNIHITIQSDQTQCNSEARTVSSLTTPIPTAVEKETNIKSQYADCSRTFQIEPDPNHCSCCMHLRRFCKRQKTILEYIKPHVSKCFCSEIENPKISNRLKLFLNNYKQSYSADFDLGYALKTIEEHNGGTDNLFETDDLEELHFVFSYQSRLINRISTCKNVFIKMRIYNLLSKYTYDSDPVELATKFGEICSNELLDVYRDFMGFLTPAQADRMGMFKYYLKSCFRRLINKIKQEVVRKDHLKHILKKLQQVCDNNRFTSCEMCTKLLECMWLYPRLAEYVFKLFPHGSEERKHQKICSPSKSPDKKYFNEKETVDNTKQSQCEFEVSVESKVERLSRSPEPIPQKITEKGDVKNTSNEDILVENYEADNSSNDADIDHVKSIVKSGTQERHLTIQPLTLNNIKDEDSNSVQSDETNHKSNENNHKSDKQETDDDDSDTSMVIDFEDSIKQESVEWKRDEDKLILELLHQFVIPNEQNSKPILDIITESNVFELLADTLMDKSVEEIKDRVFYLLNIVITDKINCKYVCIGSKANKIKSEKSH